MVLSRHFNLSHRIGRSGNITDPQPKAVGSSIIAKLTDHLALEAVRVAGLKHIKSSIVLPMATGMALRECFISLRLQRPQANHIIWPRIDQKSCLKSMLSIGLNVIVIEPKLADKGFVTDIQAIEAKIEELGAENILEAVAKISHTAKIP